MSNNFKSLCYFGLIPASKSKFWELELIYAQNFTDWFKLDLSLTRKVDHAGLTFIVSLLGASLSFIVLDSRHWNEETNSWDEPLDESGV